MTSIYEFKAKSLDNQEIDFNDYRGDVLLIVNTASHCGFTSQYAGLEELQKKFEGKGLKVLGFPCNQFGAQEPGDASTIANFCQKNYGVSFQMFDKVDVNGADAHPIYKFLTHSAPGLLGSEGIKWNFTKFLVNKKGEVVKRYAPTVTPDSLVSDIEKMMVD
ncbi:MAG: glutathione peroxidase [Candidatus Obscuribacterales bacterium]|nr:glutathione peroxidase [Candidatus Obscuribacterales bacterium]